MLRFLISTSIFFLLKTTSLLAQTEGWSSTCSTNDPSVSEVMVDACGDEFKSEYVVLKTGNKNFDIRNLVMTVVNPFNNAFVGSASVQNNNLNSDALRRLNDAATTTCGYGTVFRDAFHTPYDGIVPPNTTILFFNNKDSTDVAYLSPGELSRLCGSKVLVVFGTLNPQSRGVSIFRNYPQNGSCGATGCLRQIQFQFGGATAPFCTQFTYDFKKLPNLNTSNPPVGFNEGSYIRPVANGSLTYGGGNLTGAGVVCMPPAKLMCTIPTMPDYGDGFWNVLAFDGFNDWSNGSFKGYYQGKGNLTLSVGTATADNFEFNTVRDGWGGTQAPSEAHSTIGALTTYNGCNVRADSFSILAKRKGFTCGYYDLTLNYYDDFARVRIDNNGDGTWDFDQSYNPPACNAGCRTTIWQGFLSPQSKIEIYGYDLRGNFNVHVLFQRRTTPPSVKINVLATTPVVCGGPPTGSITTTVTGGITPYSIVWSGAVPIANGSLSATNLPAGLFRMRATDGVGCVDSAQILVPQTNNIVVKASGGTSFCPGGTAILRGTASGGTGSLNAEWLTTTSQTVLATGLNYSPTVSKSTNYVLRVTDASGCFKMDTVAVNVYALPVIHVFVTPNDTSCNDAVPVIHARGAQSYTWSSFPPIGAAALDARGDSARLFSLFLPAPYYVFTATGTDGNGCVNTGQAVVTLVPLPVVTITPVLDTLCDNGAPRPLTFSPATGGNLTVFLITPAANIPCPTCIENGVFYPNRSGAGDFLVIHEMVNAAGCRNSPSMHVNVKNCRCTSSITVPLSKNICQGDSFKIKNTFYKTSGVYRDTFRKTDGCDSVTILSLVVNKLDTTRLSLKTCNPASVGTTSQVLRNQYGCDSLVITTKTFGRHDTTRYTYLICVGDSVLVNNVWIKRAGETRFNLLNAEGCDSIVMANIAFTKLDTTLINATSCDPTRVGIDSVHKTNRFGCDSLVITQTLFALKDTTRFQILTCNAALLGTDIKTYRNQLGCDSIVITQTVLNRRDSTRLNWFICETDSLAFNNRWIKTRGTYFETRTNSVGCDSVLVLTLDFWKKDTVIVQKTSCNPLLVGDTTKILRGYHGCDSVVITQTRLVPTDMKDSLTVSKPISCNGVSDGALRVKINTGGRSPFQYNWANGATTTQINDLRAGLYRVTVTDTEGCRLVDSFVLQNPPPLSISVVGVPPTCFGDNIGSIKITSYGGGTAPYQFIWGALSQNLTKTPMILNNIQRGAYPFKLIDGAGCAFDSTVLIPLATERTLDIGANRTIELGDSVEMGAVLNFKTAQIKWTSRDGQIRCDSCIPLLVKPLETTTYKLTVKDSLGCEINDVVTVFVEKSRKIFIPTTFSPNDDGVNDHFTAFTDHAVRKIQTLKVFNRWGSPLFEQHNFLPNDETQGWDGKWRGAVLPPDIYVFFMKIEFEDGKVGFYQGDVTIMK